MSVLEIPSEQYHADQVADRPTLSAGLACVLINQSPAHAKAAHPKLNPDYKRVDDDKFSVGRAAHSLLLEGIENVHIVHADNWRTKAAKEERELAQLSGRVPLLANQWDEVQRMCEAVRRQLPTFGLDPEPLTDGQPEQTLVWEEDGVLCRCRIDWLHNDHRTVRDIKTTKASASHESWGRTMYSIGADVQVAFYSRGIQAVYGTYMVDWTYIVCETYPPYEIALHSLAPSALELANQKVDVALKVWKRCLELDRWDGYPRQVAYAEAPSWELSRWLEREAMEAAA